ncbi:holo-ACP synthase [Candidatus Phytoplasma oryzae]|nr:holo-ACP synthase [Candidatus Phytoplasma oryzae]
MKGIGIDLIEIKRIKKIGLNQISKRILSEKEYKIYNQINNLNRKLSFIAGRWAGKEAIFKAYQKGHSQNKYHEWSILNNEKYGFPYIENTKNHKIMISITHEKNYAAAFVIILA